MEAKEERNRLFETEDLLLGFKHCSNRPIKDVNSKWYIPNYLFSGEFFPNFLGGQAYIMSFYAAQKLYEGGLIAPLFYLDDVFLTGIVAKRIQMKCQHHPIFCSLPDKDLCSLKGRLVQHDVTPTDMMTFYEFVTNSKTVCAAPEKNFVNFLFNFKQLRRSINCF